MLKSNYDEEQAINELRQRRRSLSRAGSHARFAEEAVEEDPYLEPSMEAEVDYEQEIGVLTQPIEPSIARFAGYSVCRLMVTVLQATNLPLLPITKTAKKTVGAHSTRAPTSTSARVGAAGRRKHVHEDSEDDATALLPPVLAKIELAIAGKCTAAVDLTSLAPTSARGRGVHGSAQNKRKLPTKETAPFQTKFAKPAWSSSSSSSSSSNSSGGSGSSGSTCEYHCGQCVWNQTVTVAIRLGIQDEGVITPTTYRPSGAQNGRQQQQRPGQRAGTRKGEAAAPHQKCDYEIDLEQLLGTPGMPEGAPCVGEDFALQLTVCTIHKVEAGGRARASIQRGERGGGKVRVNGDGGTVVEREVAQVAIPLEKMLMGMVHAGQGTPSASSIDW
jgi:hypothetical protein